MAASSANSPATIREIMLAELALAASEAAAKSAVQANQRAAARFALTGQVTR